jgi:hypothetical protein
MKKVKLLLCMLSVMSLAVLTACDDDDDNGSGGGGGGTNDGVAPSSLVGQTMNVTIDDPPENAGTYTITFVDESSYTSSFGDGTYTYTPSGATAELVLDAADSEDTVSNSLTFDSSSSGSIFTQATDVDGNVTFEESGTFTLDAGSEEPPPAE